MHVIVLTGERGVGKSTLCRKTVSLAQNKGYTCRGIVTLSHPDDRRDLLDVSSGDARPLTLEPGARPAVIQGRFYFDPQTIAWGNSVLARATPCHLLVVDELGPLEIERREGLQKAFDALRKSNFTLALIVIRPELLVQAHLRLPTSATAVFTVTLDNRDALPAVFLEMLKEELGSP